MSSLSLTLSLSPWCVCVCVCVCSLQFIEMLSKRYFTMVIDEWCTSKRYCVFDDQRDLRVFNDKIVYPPISLTIHDRAVVRFVADGSNERGRRCSAIIGVRTMRRASSTTRTSWRRCRSCASGSACFSAASVLRRSIATMQTLTLRFVRIESIRRLVCVFFLF